MSRVYQIPPRQKGLSPFVKGSLQFYDYYVAELGLNVMVGKDTKITSLLCNVDLQTGLLSPKEIRTDQKVVRVLPQ